MLRAADALEGFETALFQHKKGPLELLVVMATWSLTGISSEWMTRLPFAWASLLALIGVFLIGRRLDRSHAGGLATCLLAVEGYLVAFGRITQYQSVVLLFSILAFLCLLIYYQSRHPALLLLAAASMGVGFLAHYDIIFVLPAVLFLLGARLWQDRNQGWRMWAPVVAAGFLGIGLVALFYVPFFNSGYVDQTAAYIGRRIGSSIHNNLWTTFKLTLVYDSIYLVMILIMGVSLHLWVLASRFGNWAKAALIVLLVLGESALLRPNLWLFAGVSIAILPFILLFVGAFFAPRQRLELRAVWVWMAIPSLFYLFLVEEAYTHVHIFFTPWALLAAIGLIDMARRARDWSLRERRLGLATGGVIAFLALIYPIIMFVNHVPEYQRTFPENKLSIFWIPFDEMPTVGLFGFPYRAGWKTVSQLMATGQFEGDYATNEESVITSYYTRHMDRRYCPTPDMYITAVNVQDDAFIRWDQIVSDYHPASEVTVAGMPKLTVYRLTAQDETMIIDSAALEKQFDLSNTPAAVSSALQKRTSAETVPELIASNILFGDFVRLIGYQVTPTTVAPGEYVTVTLLWEPIQPTSVAYKQFTHLFDGETMIGQLDGPPFCGISPTFEWQPDEQIVDSYRVPVRTEAPQGNVPLLIGLYDGTTLERLPVTNGEGELLGDIFHLTNVDVKQNS